MATDHNHLSEEELNRQRKAQHEAEHQDGDGIIGTVDRAFRSTVNPVATSDEPDEDELQGQRELNDEATRNS